MVCSPDAGIGLALRRPGLNGTPHRPITKSPRRRGAWIARSSPAMTRIETGAARRRILRPRAALTAA